MEKCIVIIAGIIAAVSVVVIMYVFFYLRRKKREMDYAIFKQMRENEKQIRENQKISDEWFRTLKEKEALERLIKKKLDSVDRIENADADTENEITSKKE